MYLANLTNRGAVPALINTLAFAEARHRMLAENIANWQTPEYKAKNLDVKGFQRALRRALDEKGKNASKPFVLADTPQVGTRVNGTLRVTPTRTQPGNVLFHDGTNASIDRMMTDLADNAMTHQAATQMLKGYFDAARKAIRGQL
jgi:flagellar basal-body rod protein FlgB